VIFSVPVCDKSLFAKLAAIWLFSGVYTHMMNKTSSIFQDLQAFWHRTLVIEQLVLRASGVGTLKIILCLYQNLSFLLP
tara:strand:- start:595 stop:831 length:237 start_codon:yes stop_codon:yes gene_type:complete